MELNSKIREALLEMQFVNRFEELSQTFSAERTPSDERLIYVDGEEVMDMISGMGYTPLFDGKEKYNRRMGGKMTEMSVEGTEFIRMFLMHVLPKEKLQN